VLAVIVSLLEATWVRIGNAEYARDNNSYGLTTLKNRHVQFIRDGGCGRLPRQGRCRSRGCVDDKRLAKLVRRCHQLPGTPVSVVDEDGSRHQLDSGQVNAYLHDVMGADFTAKISALGVPHCVP